MPDLFPDEENLQVRVVRNKSTGDIIGFQDPETGKFISRADALPRLRYSVEKSRIEDSFGNEVGVGAIGTPKSGQVVQYRIREAEYRPVAQDPATLHPAANQEIIERTFIITPDGKIVTTETSYGLGKKLDQSKTGGRWRTEISEALGIKPGTRLPTKDLERAVARKEYLIKTIE